MAVVVDDAFIGQVAVNSAGYEWGPDPTYGDDVVLASKRGGQLSTYDPLQKSSTKNLYLDFAHMSVERDAILEFADRHGVWGPANAECTVWNSELRLIGPENWERQVRQLQCCLQLWQAIKDKNLDVLRTFAIWTTELELTWPLPSFVSEDLQSQWRNWGREQGYRRPALLDPCRDLLRWVLDHELSNSAYVLRPEWMGDNLGIRVFAYGLFACVWVQFALAVNDGVTIRNCTLCGKSFTVGPNSGRPHRLFCTEGCRIKSHQHKLTKAKQMRRDGATQRDIANALGTPYKTVRNWFQ